MIHLNRLNFANIIKTAHKVVISIVMLSLFGCKFNSGILVKFASKAKEVVNEISSKSSYELSEYRFSIRQKTESGMSVTLVDENYAARTIDLGIKAESIETISYSENFWIFEKIERDEAWQVQSSFYYLNFNDAVPEARNFADQVDIPCIVAEGKAWIRVIRGYIYCIDSASHLMKINLSDYSDRVVFNTITINSNYYFLERLSIEENHYFDGNALYLRINSGSTPHIIRIEGNVITGNWAVAHGGYYVDSMNWVNNELITINSMADLTIYTNTNSTENIVFPGFSRTVNINPMTTNHILVGHDVYNLVCDGQYYKGALGLYKTNISNLRVPTTEFFSLGQISCDGYEMRLFNLSNVLYLKGQDTADQKTYLYRFDSSSSEKFQKVIELADFEYFTMLSSDGKSLKNSFYSDLTKLCFSGKSVNSYRPYCLDENHNLQVMGAVSSIDPFHAPVKFKKYNDDLLFLAKNEKVKMYKTNFTNKMSSEVLEVNTLLDLDYAWEPVYARYENTDTILTAKDSYLAIVTFSDLNAEVTIQDWDKNEYKHNIKRVNNGSVRNLHAYKEKALVAYGYNDYYDLIIYEKEQNRKIPLDHNILFTQDRFIASYIYRYVYFINVKYQLMRLDLETEKVVVVDDKVPDFYAVEGRVFYYKNDLNEIYEINEDLEKRVIGSLNPQYGMDDLENMIQVSKGNVYLERRINSNEERNLYIIEEDGPRLVKDDLGVGLITFGVWALSTNEKYTFLEDYVDDEAWLYVVNNETGIVESKHLIEHGDFYLFNIVKNENDFPKILLKADVSSNPNYVKFLEYNGTSFEVKNYNLPALVDGDTDTLEKSNILITKDKVFFAISKAGVDQFYLLKVAPALPELIFENRHDEILATVNNTTITDKLESTFNVFIDSEYKITIHYAKIIDGYLGSIYSEYNPETNSFVEKNVALANDEHFISEVIYFQWGNSYSPTYLSYDWYNDEDLTLNRHKKYSAFSYYRNSKWYYRITEFMKYDEVIFDLEREMN